MSTYEMLWDCPYCGTEKLLGLTHRHCPSCGSAQDESKRYFPSDQDKVAVQNHVFYGADLQCPACNTPSSARAEHCGNCGSPLAGAKAAGGRSDVVLDQGQAYQGQTGADVRAEQRAAADARSAAALGKTAAPEKGMSTGLKLGLIFGGIGIVVVSAVLVVLFWKREVSVTVDHLTWKRTIAIEQYKSVKESKWCDSMPSQAYSVTKKDEERSKKKIKDGEECKKRKVDQRDGTFKEVRECKPKYREEPVYAKKCYYKLDKWAVDRTEKAEGPKDKEPAWPEVTLKKKGKCKGCEREGSRNETYTIHFVDPANSETYDCDFDQGIWSNVDAGSKWKAKSGMVFSNLDCDSLEPP